MIPVLWDAMGLLFLVAAERALALTTTGGAGCAQKKRGKRRSGRGEAATASATFGDASVLAVAFMLNIFLQSLISLQVSRQLCMPRL